MASSIGDIINSLLLRLIKEAAKETARGAYYAVIGEVLRSRLPSVISSRRSLEEQIEELVNAISEAQRAANLPSISEDRLRQIIREELLRALKEGGSQ